MIIAAPGQDKTKIRIGDELLLGLAASGNAESVKYVLDIYHMDRGDPTLAPRCASALYRAYVDPGGLFDTADPAALVPNVDAARRGRAGRERMLGQVSNDAIELIRVVGMPACIDPLVSLIPNPDRQRNWVGGPTTPSSAAGSRPSRWSRRPKRSPPTAATIKMT